MEGLIFVAGFACGLAMTAVTLMVVGACVNAASGGRAPTPRDVLAAIAPQRPAKRERFQRDDGPPEKLTAEEARERRASGA